MYVLEGNIGAGKSTLLKVMREHMPEVVVAQEPLDWHKPVEGKSLLEHFYREPQRWAYTMETFTILSRIREHRQLYNQGSCVISERSVYSGYYCFARNSYENGFMSSLEWTMCTDWFSFLIPRLCQIPQGFIYLRVSPDRAFDRVKKRDRCAESSLSRNYLEQIHVCHDRFLLEQDQLLPALKAVPILTLSTDGEFETDANERDVLLSKIREFTKCHAPLSAMPRHESITM